MPAFQPSSFDGYGAAKRGLFAMPSYEKLWRTPPEKRPISPWGAVEIATIIGTAPVSAGIGASSLLTLPYTTLLPIAKGARPSEPFRAMEDRATIRGGVTVLRAAGVKGFTRVDPKKLVSGIVATPGDDRKLIAAAGGGKNLRDAAARIRRVVAKNKLERAAFAARALFIAGNTAGFDAYFTIGLAIGGAATGGAATATASAVGSTRGEIEKIANPDIRKFAKVLSTEMKKLRKRRAEKDRAAKAPKAGPSKIRGGMPGADEGEPPETTALVAEAPPQKSLLPWLVGGGIAVGVLFLLFRPKR